MTTIFCSCPCSQVEEFIKKSGSEFMWSPHLGFILTCPSNLGTGVRCSVHVRIPKLAAIDKEAKLKAICKKLRLQERGTCKNPSFANCDPSMLATYPRITFYAEHPPPPDLCRPCQLAAASIHFSDGGGGQKLEKCTHKKSRKIAISNFARIARRKNENCVSLVVFFYVKCQSMVWVHGENDSAFLMGILAVHSCMIFQSVVEIYWGGG